MLPNTQKETKLIPHIFFQKIKENRGKNSFLKSIKAKKAKHKTNITDSHS